MGQAFWDGVLWGRNPGPPRPDIQVKARWLMEHASPPEMPQPQEGTPMPGRGPNGESTN